MRMPASDEEDTLAKSTTEGAFKAVTAKGGEPG
jgi:hypothetical protein